MFIIIIRSGVISIKDCACVPFNLKNAISTFFLLLIHDIISITVNDIITIYDIIFIDIITTIVIINAIIITIIRISPSLPLSAVCLTFDITEIL